MLKSTEPGSVRSILECGCNIGRNAATLRELLPRAELNLIEVNAEAYRTAVQRINPTLSFNGTIQASSFPEGRFDLVFTCGVLIHIHPDDLEACLKKMFGYSRRYILMGEYFNRTPVSIPYHGAADKLFKRDFGKLFMETFPVRCVDNGFLWGHQYDAGGFDDTTWWLFEKKA
jgi:pseudaminic acid biosynthesis-associated methylase